MVEVPFLSSPPPDMPASGLIGFRRMVWSEERVSTPVKYSGTPGDRVEPSSLTQEYFSAVGSKKTAAEVSVARSNGDVSMDIMLTDGLLGCSFPTSSWLEK